MPTFTNSDGAGVPDGPDQPTVSARRRPVASLIARRAVSGLLILIAVSVIVFSATHILPGDAATAILGQQATPERVRALDAQLHLNRSLIDQYTLWMVALAHGDLGTSLSNGESVSGLIRPRIINSAVLVIGAGLIGTLVGVLLGAYTALRRDGAFDNTTNVLLLALTSLPEFVVAIGLVFLLATVVSHVLPAVSVVPPGSYPWDDPAQLILPIATLVLVIVPYIARMMRAATIEALESEYVEFARLKGSSARRVVFYHALPNAIPPTIQVVGLTILYLAGGVVVVEYVFNYPGIGQGLVNAVDARDVPTLQAIVLLLAAFYVIVNIATDVVALMATPRRRFPR